MQNTDNLSRVGVEFKAFDLLNSTKQEEIHSHYSRIQRLDSLLPISIIKEVHDDYSLRVALKRGSLVISIFRVDEASDSILRNVIVYEHALPCSSPPFTSNYIHYLNFLISTDRDVEVLTAEEELTNGMGRPSLVLKMVNKLKVGVDVEEKSQYHGIPMDLKAHYKSRSNKCWATLNKVYFSDLWTGTATIAVILLLFLTVVGTVASVIKAYKSFNASAV